jgi:hypothetical protein
MVTRTWLGGLMATGIAGGLLAVIACASIDPTPAVPLGGAGGLCATNPGEFPIPNCTDYAPDAAMCNSMPASCDTSPCQSSSPCLALADNSGQGTANLRIRKLNVTAPPKLSSAFVQAGVIDKGINLHNICGESGDGTFSWLFQFDTATGDVTTGGAAPDQTPQSTGYCFVNATVGSNKVAPVKVHTTKNSDGSFSTDTIPKLFVPIFAPGNTAGTYLTIILPISGAQVKNVTLTNNNNCVGSYNPDAVTPQAGGGCTDDPSSCARWNTAGALGGYITLEDADTVFVPQLSESLCVLLTGGVSVDTTDRNEKKCGRDSSKAIIPKGDFCSTTNKAGGCQDSFWLAATLAASAVNIVAANHPYCMGGTISM